jgi:hypothetical protein
MTDAAGDEDDLLAASVRGVFRFGGAVGHEGKGGGSRADEGDE